MARARPTRRRSRARRLMGAILAIAVVIAIGWFAVPVLDDWLPGFSRAMQSVIATDDVNLRSGPGTTFTVLNLIPAGAELSAERETVNGFSAVRVDGKRGWIATEYLAEPGVAYAAEHEVAQAETVAVPALTSSTQDSAPEPAMPAPTSEPSEPAPPAQPEPTVVPTAVPVMAQTTEKEDQPQPGERWIEVNRTSRTVTLHNGQIVVATFDALMGRDLSADGYYSTAVGTHYVHVKEKALVETPFADGVYLTDFVGFDPQRSNGFHSPTRDADGKVVVTGGTATQGCVRLSEADARFLFDFATIGMRVDVHD